MKLLLIGSGGREHALAWKFSRENSVSELICAPGNAGIARKVRCIPVDISKPADVLDLAVNEAADFTVIGPELPLANGVADLFAEVDRPLFGPLQAAARLESSKVFAKEFMERHRIPTARFCICENEGSALKAVEGKSFGFPVVIKADGLAAGKGVTVATDRKIAEQAVHAAMTDRRFGEAGMRLVIEECLIGEEASFFAVCDGHRAVALPSAQDHKRAFDGDEGPNTGGMGAFAPSPLISNEISSQVMSEIIQPVLKGLSSESSDYRGILYVGLMLTSDGPKVIEFNVRFGDPEAQVLLPMIKTELAPILFDAARGNLKTEELIVASNPHVGVVMASGGYPGSYKTGYPIEGIDEAEAISDAMVFHAGSAEQGGRLVTNGGRVLTVVGQGVTFSEAIESVYQVVSKLSFSDQHVRTDIGQKALSTIAARNGA